MRCVRTAVVTSLLVCVLGASAGAFDGQLDPTFGVGGKVTTPVHDIYSDSCFEAVFSSAVLNDGARFKAVSD